MKLFKFSKANGMYQIGQEVQLNDTVATSFQKVGLGKIITEKPKKVTNKSDKK